MNVCEYMVKPSFFRKVEKFREDRDLGMVEALTFLGLKKTAYYDAKKRGMISKAVLRRVMQRSIRIFTCNDFEKI
jgi:hypothetical protein